MTTKINNEIFWDTSLNLGEFPEPIKKVFNQFYFKERKNFVCWIEDISKQYCDDIDWWISPPASRNLYSSDLFRNICILKTLEILIKNFRLKLVVDTYELKKTIIQHFSSKKIDVVVKKNKKSIIKFFYILYIIKSISVFLFQYFIIKFYAEKKKFTKKFTLIDTFIIDAAIKEKFYYGNIIHYAKKYKKNILFVPTIIQNNLLEFYRIVKSIAKDKNYVFKESFLKIDDLKYCIFYLFRKKKFNINYKKFENFDLSGLIRDEINFNRNLFSVFLSLYNFCFIKRLKTESLKFNKTINWFENQPMDKAWNYAFRKFFPKVETIGYQGFTHYPEYMNTIPTNYENNYNVIPKKIVVMSKNYKNLRKEFCKSLEIIDGPALRFENIFLKDKKKNKRFNIVIFLEGASIERDREVILKFIRISKNFPNLKFYIKSHPILPTVKLNIKLPKKFIELNEKFSFIANNTYISVVYGSTSATLESLAYGCKLILPFDNLHDKSTLQKLKIKKTLYKVCSNDKKVINAIHYFMKGVKIKNKKKNLNIKYFLFNKVTKKNIRNLL